MRAMGYRVVDMLVDRISRLGEDAAWRGASRAQLDAHLREPAPEAPTPFEDLLQTVQQHVLRYAARVDHPRFMAFVPGSPTWPGILGDFIGTGHNIFQGTWLGSSGPSALELVVIDWFREWIGYPESAAGLLLSGGSAANLTALACARLTHARDASRAVIYHSDEAHSSVARAIRILGFEHVRVIDTEAGHRLDPRRLEAAIRRDLDAGLEPHAVIASAGTTSTGAIDPIDGLAGVAEEHGLWLHVDAAYGGFAVLSSAGRSLFPGLERADSITLDPHKWLYQPFEAGCVLVRDGGRLHHAFSVSPHYLQDTAVEGEEVNFGERGFQLTRSARALKIWLALKYFGLQPFRDAVDRSIALAVYAGERISRSPRLELLSPPSLGIVCFRRRFPEAPDRTDELNAALLGRLAESGLALISSTRVGGLYALRLCILNHTTTRGDVDAVLDFLENGLGPAAAG